jgi:hypothetical protein
LNDPLLVHAWLGIKLEMEDTVFKPESKTTQRIYSPNL